MIKLSAINKFYNKRKANERHVLKDLSLTLEDKGLVVLLGPSGSGKTTLLNVLGGLDDLNNGQLTILDERFKKYQTKKWDLIRAVDIGVIFQNYNLLEKETVFENIALTLRMLGYKDKEIIEDRVMTLLKAVKLERYHKRRANQLSGGQQQRVAIARALAKKPKLLLTDEPTGNLDSKNTFEIMRILRKIADQTLVVMVTHEEDLAIQFSDRILRLEDGRIISDEQNTPNADFVHHFDGDIYLRDFKHKNEIKNENSNIRIHSDEPIEKPLHLDLVIEQNTLYLKVDQDTLKKIILVEKNSDIQFKDTKRSTSKVDVTDDYDLDVLDTFEKKANPTHVLDVKNTIKMTFKNLLESSRGMKVLYAGFILAGALIALAVGFLSNIVFINEDSVRVYPNETVSVLKSNIESFDALRVDYVDSTSATGYYFGFEIGYAITVPRTFQSTGQFFSYGNVFNDSIIEESDLLEGRLIEANNEVVLDALVADALFNTNQFRALNINSYEPLLNLDIIINETTYQIVGITNYVANGIYLNDEGYIETLARSKNTLNLYNEDLDITIIQGRAPNAISEVIISEGGALEGGLMPATVEVSGQILTVVGTYTPNDSNTLAVPLVTEETVYKIDFDNLMPSQSVYLFSDDADTLMRELPPLLNPVNTLEETISNTRADNISQSIGLFIFTLIALSASALSFYFIVRSSLIQRVRDIGIYRSLGIRSFDILKLFLAEAIILTTATSLIGYLGMTYILNQIQQATQEVIEVLSVSVLSVGLGILFIYTVNVISGLLPVLTLLRKTPSNIMTKYDI